MIHVATVEILMRFEETDAYDHVDLYQQDAINLILHQSAQCLIVSHRYYHPLTGKQDPINHNSSSTKPSGHGKQTLHQHTAQVSRPTVVN